MAESVHKRHYIDMDKVKGYEELEHVLTLAYDQAARGKGKARHGKGRTFTKQPIIKISELAGSGFTIGQAVKKLLEADELPWDKAEQDILGVIVYVAGYYLYRESQIKKENE